MWADRFMGIWLEAMADDASRLAVEGLFGGIWGFSGWWILERFFRRIPPVAKSWFPFVVAGLAVPFSAFVASLVPGIAYAELAGVVGAVGAVAAKGTHDMANRFPAIKDVSGVRPPGS